MARPAASHIFKALTTLLPRNRIREMARELGVVQRRRKLDIVALVYSLALGSASATIARCRVYAVRTCVRPARAWPRNGFYGRLTSARPLISPILSTSLANAAYPLLGGTHRQCGRRVVRNAHRVSADR